jgi:hypothetical protein
MIKKWFFISLTGIILLILIAACTQTAATPILVELDDAQMEALIIEKCSQCHTADRVFRADYSETQWSATFDDMINKGADVSPEEKEVMIDWLVSRDQ